MCIIATI